VISAIASRTTRCYGFYVLAEAQHEWAKAAQEDSGNDDAKNSIHVRVGPVGGWIVTVVLVGLLLGDSFSFLSQWPSWKTWFSDKGKLGIAELIKDERSRVLVAVALRTVVDGCRLGGLSAQSWTPRLVCSFCEHDADGRRHFEHLAGSRQVAGLGIDSEHDDVV